MIKEKFDFHLKKLENRFPNKQKLNAGEMLSCINKSRSTFYRIIDANNLHLLPKFTFMEYKRSTSSYNSYQFDIYDIAEFLAK